MLEIKRNLYYKVYFQSMHFPSLVTVEVLREYRYGLTSLITDLSADDVFQSLYYRSLVISWLKGCMLYVAENYRWSKEIGEFVEWSVYYDLWSKIILFAPQWSNCNEKTTVDPRKYGPANMLDMMPVTFTRDQLENKRESLNKPKDAKSQLWVWQDRGYITYDEANGCYTKTADYLANHPQQNV